MLTTRMIPNKYKVILASNSPRRKELLKGLDLDFEVRVMPDIKEEYPSGLETEMIPQYIACEKAAAYTLNAGELLITADTVVILDGKVLGKPADEHEAKRMLRTLSGKTHLVTTGVCMATVERRRAFHVTTEVTFKELSDDEIDYYVSVYKPLDKAGAYGIQEWIGFVGVTSLKGSFFNVMGLPVQRIHTELYNF